jgi:molybdopterin converting factor small subunit
MQIRVLAFAKAADLLGWRELLAECTALQSPREIVATLSPGFDPGTWRVALDCEYCSWDEPIGALREELAIIPPVSGG